MDSRGSHVPPARRARDSRRDERDGAGGPPGRVRRARRSHTSVRHRRVAGGGAGRAHRAQRPRHPLGDHQRHGDDPGRVGRCQRQAQDTRSRGRCGGAARGDQAPVLVGPPEPLLSHSGPRRTPTIPTSWLRPGSSSRSMPPSRSTSPARSTPRQRGNGTSGRSAALSTSYGGPRVRPAASRSWLCPRRTRVRLASSGDCRGPSPHLDPSRWWSSPSTGSQT